MSTWSATDRNSRATEGYWELSFLFFVFTQDGDALRPRGPRVNTQGRIPMHVGPWGIRVAAKLKQCRPPNPMVPREEPPPQTRPPGLHTPYGRRPSARWNTHGALGL